METPENKGRRSVRLKGYDYGAPGGYFVTLVTRQREALFGRIAEGEMILNALGEIVEECWDEIPIHFSHADVDAFVVMPNHIHGIIFIHQNDLDSDASPGRGTIYRAPTLARRAPVNSMERFGKPTVGSLPTIVRTFKAAVTRRAGRELNCSCIWQRGFYEHILRGQADYERIAGYILANPRRWAEDEENRMGR